MSTHGTVVLKAKTGKYDRLEARFPYATDNPYYREEAMAKAKQRQEEWGGGEITEELPDE